MIVGTLEHKAMSGEEENNDRQFAKTDTEAKRKKAREKRSEKLKKSSNNILTIFSGGADVCTDSTPLIKKLIPIDVQLRSITVYVGSISQPQMEIVVHKKGATVNEISTFPIKEGLNEAEIVIDAPSKCLMSVYLKHPGDFRVEDIQFSALVTYN